MQILQKRSSPIFKTIRTKNWKGPLTVASLRKTGTLEMIKKLGKPTY
jgi:hypothetical protein